MNKSSVIFPVSLLLCAFFISGIMAVTYASAQVTFTSDEAQFFADNPGLVIQTFNSGFAPQGAAIGCDTPLDSNNSADCFPPGAIIPGVVYTDAPFEEFLDLFGMNFDGASGNTSQALGIDNSGETLDIIFERGGVTAAGIRPGCFVLIDVVCRDTVTISVFDSEDVLIGSTQVEVSSLFDDFLGVESDIPVKRISIDAPASLQAISELAFPQGALSEIPTLSEWGMISAAAGLGLVGVWFAVRQRLQATIPS